VRLDHLLSKEHLEASAFQAPDQSECLCGELMGGTFDKASEPDGSSQYVTSVVGTGGPVGAGACTLLGPEGPDGDLLSGGCRPNLRAFSGCRSGKRGGYRPYFENYTVDASIFGLTQVRS
jgi:hypothetical protein